MQGLTSNQSVTPPRVRTNTEYRADGEEDEEKLQQEPGKTFFAEIPMAQDGSLVDDYFHIPLLPTFQTLVLFYSGKIRIWEGARYEKWKKYKSLEEKFI